MKNQYVGDLHDYRKLAILRLLVQQYDKIGICWMLTKNDPILKDGGKISYLETKKEKKYKPLDPELYEELKKIISEDKRNVKELELLLNKLNKGKFKFWNTLESNPKVDLIFFDPDNGFGETHKHLSWEDINQYKESDILSIHFFNRQKGKTHKIQVAEIIEVLEKKGIKKNKILPIKAGSVVYFYISNSEEKITNAETKFLENIAKDKENLLTLKY
jgi:hypothetical protein